MIMKSNIEKASEIVGALERRYKDTKDLLWTDIYDAVNEMAEWKDNLSNRKQEIAEGCITSFFLTQDNTLEQVDYFFNAIREQIETTLNEEKI